MSFVDTFALIAMGINYCLFRNPLCKFESSLSAQEEKRAHFFWNVGKKRGRCPEVRKCHGCRSVELKRSDVSL